MLDRINPLGGKVEGFSFRVTGANGYDQTFKTDKNGEIFIEGLRVGDYTVSEVSDGASANYVLPADKKVTILADKTTVAVGGPDGRIRYGRCRPGRCGLCGQAQKGQPYRKITAV